ncbi:MAG: diguanylate phosphodiesterase, partial [Lachnospiraceae bacterium]|nr:diguanylate phosphodiesterase [Lachnospiraceae bacterium]
EVKRALLVKEGDPGKLFQLILCYEQADWKSIKELVAYFQIPANVIAQLYINCVEEVNQIWEGLTNGFERLGE